jgi:hypothetical protein
MKKAFPAVLLAISILCSLSVAAYASTTSASTSDTQVDVAAELARLDLDILEPEQYDEVIEASNYAYLSLDDYADDPAMQEKILSARNTIIYRQSWTNLSDFEGMSITSTDMETGEVTYYPDFYDLFPEEWDVP